MDMEKDPIVNAEQEKKTDFYNDVLSKRIRPKVTIEETEVKNLEKEAELNIKKEEPKEPSKGKQQVYSTEEATKASTVYFNGDSLAANVWVNKYALKSSEGHLYEQTPDDMHHRIAREIARIEAKYPNPMSEKEVFELIRNFKYVIPQGSPMAGIGNTWQIGSLSNCFVIGNDGSSDSYGGIMKTMRSRFS
jgi:ribonucleotide reductase alpha subunit